MMQAIIFDFFGVIVTEGFQQFEDTYLKDDLSKRQQADALMNRFNLGVGNMTYREFITDLAKLAQVDVQTVGDHLEDNVPNHLLLDYIRSQLKPKYKIGILSNSGGDWVSELLEPEDVKLFDEVVLSYKVGVTKPNPQIYKLAADGLSVKVEECVFIDDIERYCEAARTTDMQAIRYENFPKMKKELENLLSGSND